jgi:hypothetical protein
MLLHYAHLQFTVGIAIGPSGDISAGGGAAWDVSVTPGPAHKTAVEAAARLADQCTGSLWQVFGKMYVAKTVADASLHPGLPACDVRLSSFKPRHSSFL